MEVLISWKHNNNESEVDINSFSLFSSLLWKKRYLQ